MTILRPAHALRAVLLAGGVLAAAGCTPPPPQPYRAERAEMLPPGRLRADEPLVRAERQEIQSLLNGLGYRAGRADGVIGERTRIAIRSYQADKGWARDGFVSAALLAALQADAERLGLAAPPVRRTETVAATAPRAPVRREPVAARTTAPPPPATTDSAATPTTPRPVFIRRESADRDGPGDSWN